MLKINKKGSLETKEILEVILAAAGILILVLLFFKLVFPYNPEKETAKAYFDDLKSKIAEVDAGHAEEFYMWQPEVDTKYFVVYFGQGTSFITPINGTSVKFSSIGNNENHICVCYVEKGSEKGICPSCMNLDLPIYGEESKFAVGREKIEIKKDNNNYFFITKKA